MAPTFDDLVSELLQDDARSRVVTGEQVVELRLVVPAARPGQRAEVSAVCCDEVVEGAQEVCAQRVPQPQLGGRPSVEEGTHVDAVGALRSSGQARGVRQAVR